MLKQSRTNKRDKCITICSLSNSSYFIDKNHQITGGSERQIKYIVDALSKNGTKVQVLVTNATNIDRANSKNLTFKNLWYSHNNFIYKIFKLTKILSATNSHIYMRGLSWAHLYIILVSRILNRKVILAMTSDVQCVKNPSPLINLMRMWSCRMTSLLLSQTNKQKMLLRDNFGANSFVYNNLISSTYLNKSYQTNNPFQLRDIDALWMGAIEPRKGVSYLIDIAKRMPDKKITIVGNGRDEFKNFELEMLSQFNELPNVSVLGFIQPDLVGAIISSSKVLLNTSPVLYKGVTKEGFPNVFLEAWLFGTPVVSLFHDPDGLIKDNNLGRICNDIQLFYDSVNELSLNQDLWDEISEQCQKWVKGRDVYFKNVRDDLGDILFSDE
jgi:glycosyltransferase involved in cell wall biosynthesis